MANGLLDLLGGAIGTTPPAYLEGLLGQNAVEDLRKRSIGSGLVNALVGYAAIPKNQGLGLGRILAGTAQAGMQGAQGVYDTATQDYIQGQKIAEMKLQQEQQKSTQNAINQLLQDPRVASDPMAVAFIKSNPSEALKMYASPRERKTAVVGNKVIDTSTGQEIYVGEKDLKALPTYEVQRGRTKYTIQIQPDGTEKVIGQGSMDAPKEPKEISYKIETGADNNIYYVPLKPNSPILDVNGRPTNAFKPAGAKPTEDQAKAAGWLSQATNAYNNMKKVMFLEGTQIPTGAESPSALESTLSAVGLEGAANLARSAPRQQFVQGTKSLSEALLRAATGAGVNKDEAAQKVEELTPQWTDDPLTKQQKLEAIPIYLESLKIRAGSSGQSIIPATDKVNILPTGSKMTKSPATGNRDRDAILKQYGVNS